MPSGRVIGATLLLALSISTRDAFGANSGNKSGDKKTSAADRRAALVDSLLRERLNTRSKATAVDTPARPAFAAPAPPSDDCSTCPGSRTAHSTATARKGAAMASPAPAELPIPDSLVVQSLNVRNADIRDVLHGLALQYGLNIAMAPDVSGLVSVNFSKLKLKDALQRLARENGYRLAVSDGTIEVKKLGAPKTAGPD